MGTSALALTKEQLDQVGRVQRRLLRSVGRFDIPEELIAAIKPGHATHAPRRSGKTRALLYVVDFREHGDAIIVCSNEQGANDLRASYLQQKYSGKPRFISADRLLDFWGDGHKLPFYCDEFWSFSESIKTWLSRSGRVGGAIGTAKDGVGGLSNPTGSDLSHEVISFPL